MFKIKYYLIAILLFGGYTVAFANDAFINDRVSLIVKIVEIKSAVDAYVSTDATYATGTITDEILEEWNNTLKMSVTNQTIEDYKAIDPSVQAVTSTEITPLLEKLILPESHALVTSKDRDVREQRRLVLADARMISDRLEQVVHTIYPSHKEYFSVASILLGLATEHAASAISKDGVVQNMQELAMVRALNWNVRESKPRWVSYCDRQRELVAEFTDMIYQNDDNSVATKLGQSVSVTAENFYQLAKSAEQTAIELPSLDEEICQ